MRQCESDAHTERHRPASVPECALASKKRTVSKRGFVISAGLNLLGCARGPKQTPSSDCMAADRAVKVLLATGPRALLRSTLTARSSAKVRC